MGPQNPHGREHHPHRDREMAAPRPAGLGQADLALSLPRSSVRRLFLPCYDFLRKNGAAKRRDKKSGRTPLAYFQMTQLTDRGLYAALNAIIMLVLALQCQPHARQGQGQLGRRRQSRAPARHPGARQQHRICADRAHSHRSACASTGLDDAAAWARARAHRRAPRCTASAWRQLGHVPRARARRVAHRGHDHGGCRSCSSSSLCR